MTLAGGGLVAALVAALAAAGCISDDGGPRLDTADPPAASRGTIVTLTGRRLCGEPPLCETAGGAIRIGIDSPIVHANVVAYSDTIAQIVIPQLTPLGRTELIATVNERASNALSFEVLP